LNLILVSASKFHADSYYTVSGMGEVMCHTIKGDVFEEIATHRFTESAEKAVESAIRARDFASAYSRVISISRSKRPPGQLLAESEEDLIRLCTIGPVIAPESWTRANPDGRSNDRLDMLNNFKADLENFSYFIPPRYVEFPQWIKDVLHFVFIVDSSSASIGL
jgi:hypothetical protein